MASAVVIETPAAHAAANGVYLTRALASRGFVQAAVLDRSTRAILAKSATLQASDAELIDAISNLGNAEYFMANGVVLGASGTRSTGQTADR